MKMLIEKLSTELKEALAVRLDATELIDLLQIPIEDVIEIFEDLILDNLSDVLELAKMEDLQNVTD